MLSVCARPACVCLMLGPDATSPSRLETRAGASPVEGLPDAGRNARGLGSAEGA